MSDMFTIKSIPVTPELGMALKNFRIENNVTATSIVRKFEKASSYVTKLEKGDIKNIDTNFLIELCNFISSSDDGLSLFFEKIKPNYLNYSQETKIILMNIDDLLFEYKLPKTLINDINCYLKNKKISISQLTNRINENRTVVGLYGYDNAPLNEWYSDGTFDNIFIKLQIPQTYIEALCNNEMTSIHRVIAEALLTSMYALGDPISDDLGNELSAQNKANDTLSKYQLFRKRGLNSINYTDYEINEMFSELEPEILDILKEIIISLKLIILLSGKESYGKKRISQIRDNLHRDIGFAFAYMSCDITEIEKKDRETKQNFLFELRDLVNKYSKEDDSPQINIYE